MQDLGERTMKLIRWTAMAVVLSLAFAATAYAQAGAAAPADTSKAKAAKTKHEAPDPSKIAQAPGGGGGKVWVNSETKVYHKEGDPWYGKTKHGEYMTEADAQKGGNHLAKEGAVKKDKKDAMEKPKS